MPRSRVALYIVLAALGAGCQETAHKRVYVDVEAVLASYRASPLPSRPTPKPPGGLPATTLSVPAVSPRTIIVQAASDQKAQALLEANRKKSVRELTRLVAQRYVREVDRAGAERIRALAPGRRAAYEDAQKAVRAEFETYADKRGAKVVRLTSLVGFPDPNPLSLTPTTPVPKYVLDRLAEAAALRTEIAALEAEYERRVGEILAGVAKQYDIDLTQARLEIEQDREAAIAKAEKEALNDANAAYKALSPLLISSMKVDLRGQPAQSVTLPAVKPPMAAPQIREQTLNAAQRRKILEDQLHIWISTNGYELSKSADGVEDVTAQFVKWREDRKL